jgi:cytidylate kinase
VAYYDKALVKALQERYNLSVDALEQLKGQEQSWWAEFKRKMTFSDDEYDLNRTGIETESVFLAEREILQTIARDESCVIAGRSGFSIFRDHPNHVSILIQASLPHRIARVMREQGLSESAAREVIERVDKMRENYVREFTGCSRYDTRNYHIVLSMDELSEDAAVDIIMTYIRNMK